MTLFSYRSLPYIAAFLALSVSLWAFGSQSTQQIRDLKGFSRIVLAGSASAEIVQGEDFKVQVIAPKNVLDKVLTRVDGDALTLKVKSGGWFNEIDDSKVTYKISMPVIKVLQVAGSGDIRIDSLVARRLSLSIRGNGDIRIKDLTAQSLSASVLGSGAVYVNKVTAVDAEASIKGSGTIRMSGEIQNQVVSVVGSGEFDGAKLVTDNATGSITGSGDISIAKTNHQSFSVLGSGEVSVAHTDSMPRH